MVPHKEIVVAHVLNIRQDNTVGLNPCAYTPPDARAFPLPPLQVDLLPSDGVSGDGPERPGAVAAGTQKEIGSLKDVLAKWEERLPGATVLPISALEGINTIDVRGEWEGRLVLVLFLSWI